MNKTFQKFLSMFLAFTLVLTLLPALELPVKAESPAPDYAVTFSAADTKYVVTPAGGSANKYDTFGAAIGACTGDGTQVIQLGTAETPLPIVRTMTVANNALSSATFTGNVQITDATITDNTSSCGLVVPASVTAAFRDFTLTNATAVPSGFSYFAVCVGANGILNIGNNTNLSINGKLSNNSCATDYTVSNGGTLNIHGSDIQIKGGTAGGAITSQKDCTIGGNDGDSKILVIADPASLNNTIGNNSGTMSIGKGVTVDGVKSIAVYNNSSSTLTISGGTVTTAASDGVAGRTLDNQGTLNITGGNISFTGTYSVGRALWTLSGITTITGGTLTSCGSQCVFANNALSIGGDCQIKCTNQNGTGVSKFNSNGKGNIAVSGNAVISGTVCGLQNGDSGEACAVTISGGTIKGCTGVNSGGILNISGGTIIGTGDNPTTGIASNSSNSVLTMTGGTVTADTGVAGTMATGISVPCSPATISGGSITAKANKAGAIVYGISCGGYSSSSYGTLNLSGASTVTADANGFDNVTAIGVLSQSYGVTNLTDGTVSSTGTTNTSAAVSEQWRNANGTTISGSVALRSASNNTVLLSKRSTSGFWYGVNCFGVTYYSSDTADISLRGDTAPGGVKLLDSASAGAAILFAALTSGYYFVSWTNDSAYKNNLNTENGAKVSELNDTTVYLHSVKGPDPPTYAYFTNQDTTPGKIGGTLHWGAPSSMVGITGYKVYWGKGTTPIGDAITEVSSSASSYTVPSTDIPTNADSFLVCTYNGIGNSAFIQVKIAVTLANESLGTRGYRSITGLTPGFGYTVTQYYNGTPSTYYAKANGMLSTQPGDLAALYAGVTYVGGGSIPLYNDNGYSYKVAYATVGLTADSLGTAGDTTITGLTSGKPYAVFDRTVRPNSYTPDFYVKADGSLSTNVNDIAPLATGKDITGLVNGNTYMVIVGQPYLTGDSLGTPGYNKVTGLTEGKKYYISFTTSGVMPVTAFVTADGSLSADETGMAPLIGSEFAKDNINGHTFMIKEYTGDTPLDENFNKLTGEFTFPVTLNDWTFKIVSDDGTVVSNTTKYFCCQPNGDTSYFDSLFATGDVSAKEHLEVSSKSGKAFSLSSLVLGANASGDFKIIGCLNGTAVPGAEKTVSVTNAATSVTFSGSAWQNINSFRIVPMAGGAEISGLALWLDNLIVGKSNGVPASTYNISGTVKDYGGSSVLGATVKVMQGSVQFGAMVTTDADGHYTVTGIPNGEYNLVVRKGNRTVTELITVNSQNYSADVTFPAAEKQSILDVIPGTPNVVVNGLDQEANYQSDLSCTITMKVEKKETGDSETIAIKNLAGNKTIEYLNIDVTKKVGSDVTPLPILSKVQEIVIPYDFSGKTDVTVYRNHCDIPSVLTPLNARCTDLSTATEGTFFADAANGKIYVYAKLFSTYAVGYSSSSGSSNTGGGSVITSCTITSSADIGGSISPIGSISVANGGNKTFTISAGDGYKIKDVLVDGVSVGAVATYTFSNITGSHTIHAEFSKSNGLPYYINDGSRVFIGFSSDASGVMKYIAPAGKTVLFAQNSKNFTDISSHWAKSYIDFVAEREIFVGPSNSNFSPDTGMTRAMFATVIGRLYERSYGALSTSGGHAFTDCNYESWYGPYIDWCSENRIVGGVGGSLFEPNREISREEMATMLYRFAEFLKTPTESSGTELHYSDSAQISSWAQKAALYCQGNGIIAGREGGSFAPQGTATRAEVAVILKRFIEKVV